MGRCHIHPTCQVHLATHLLPLPDGQCIDPQRVNTIYGRGNNLAIAGIMELKVMASHILHIELVHTVMLYVGTALESKVYVM